MSITANTTTTNTNALTFTSATAGQTITTNGKTLPAMLFNSSVPATGGWTFQDAVTVTGQIGLQAGNLNTNGKAVSALILDASDPTFNAIASAVSNSTRTLTLGNSTVTITGNTNSVSSNYIVLDLGGSNLSFPSPGTSSKIIFSGNTSGNFIGVSTGNPTKTLPDLEFGTSTSTGPQDIDIFGGTDATQRITFRNITVRRTDGIDFFLAGTANFTFGNLTFPANVNLNSAQNEKLISGGTDNQFNGTVTFGNNCNFTFYSNSTFNQSFTTGSSCSIKFSSNLTANLGFNANSSTIILSNYGSQTVSLPAGQSLYSLVVDSPATPAGTATLNSNLTVNNALTLTNGYLKTSATNTLILPSGAIVTGASNSSHIVGPVQKVGNTAFTFPTGDGATYRPISISAPASATTAFTATYFKSNPALAYPGASKAGTLDRISAVEYWTLDRNVDSGGTNSAVAVTLSWNSTSQVGNLASLRVSRYNAGTWLDHGSASTTGTTASGTITTSSLNSFSPFTLASSDINNSLPVHLLTFTSRWTDGQVELNWLTNSEKDNAYFEVERSANGLNYESVGRIPGSGTTQEQQNYQFFDARPLSGINYYRLRQVDTNGDFELSKVIAVNNPVVKASVESPLAEEAISLSPNPAASESVLLLKINASADQRYLLRLSDMQGHECWRTTVQTTKGSNQFGISGHHLLPIGLYAVQIIPLSAASAGEARSFRITVQ
jgi:hypothetical protein